MQSGDEKVDFVRLARSVQDGETDLVGDSPGRRFGAVKKLEIDRVIEFDRIGERNKGRIYEVVGRAGIDERRDFELMRGSRVNK